MATSKTRRAVRDTRAALGGPLPGEPLVRPVDMGSFTPAGWGWGNGYDGAQPSAARGYIMFPELDTRKEISSYTRLEIARRARYLFANVGFARRIVRAISRMVAGTGLMPRPTTTDRDWNKLALARFEARAGSRLSYDLAGKHNFYSAQRIKCICRYKDGDVGTAFARSPDDHRLRTLIYEAHQIANGTRTADDLATLRDGVRVNAYGRPLAYSVVDASGNATEIPANSFAMFGEFERPNQPRSLSILAHAVVHMQDMGEIDAQFKAGIKAASRIGYYIGSKDPADPGMPRLGGQRGINPVQTVTLQGGKKVALEKVFAPGGEIPELDPNKELKQLLDERPHPNTLGFLDYLIRQISLGTDLTPELLWSIVKLGGANVRYVMADAQSFIETEQQTLVDTDLGLEWILFLADELAAGTLPPCQDPEWWKHEWIPPGRMTVDIGRDGRFHLEQIRSGALTFRRFLGWQGLGLNELDEWLDEMAYLKAGAEARGLNSDTVLAMVYGRPGQAQAMPTTDPTAADPELVDPSADPAANDNAD